MFSSTLEAPVTTKELLPVPPPSTAFCSNVAFKTEKLVPSNLKASPCWAAG